MAYIIFFDLLHRLVQRYHLGFRHQNFRNSRPNCCERNCCRCCCSGYRPNCCGRNFYSGCCSGYRCRFPQDCHFSGNGLAVELPYWGCYSVEILPAELCSGLVRSVASGRAVYKPDFLSGLHFAKGETTNCFDPAPGGSVAIPGHWAYSFQAGK